MQEQKKPVKNNVDLIDPKHPSKIITTANNQPIRQGMYFPDREKDSCGVGFICHIKGQSSRQIVDNAREINCCMTHRGGQGYEKNTGDGAGILTALPHKFLQRVATSDLGIELPDQGNYGCGIVFLPQDATEKKKCQTDVEQLIKANGQRLLGWRDLPVEPETADLGDAAMAAMPAMSMLFVGADNLSQDALERKLYLIRKQSTSQIRNDLSLQERINFYICSLSTRVIIYKGMLTPEQLFPFFPDLNAPDFHSHLAMVHSRFSTNTFPSWDRAQPNRFMSHNGEINTLLGNKNWMNARQGNVASELFGEDLSQLFPIVESDCSDSGTFDNVLEFLLMTGRTLQEAIMLMIPESWQNHRQMPKAKRDFYEYNSCLMEPWDGPASIAFTDGQYIGAVLDRNGLRPSRYYITDDDRCIMASEVGVLSLDPARVIKKGRLEPGRMFLIDFNQGRMVSDEELKSDFSQHKPYGAWLEQQRLVLTDLKTQDAPLLDQSTLMPRMRAFGYTTETMQFMLMPLVQEQRDPLSSMGNDAALAVLSDEPRMLYDYFKQLYAQVTNPAIDSIREETVMALECYIGPEANLLEPTEANANRLLLPHPILSNEDMAALKAMDVRDWRSRTLDITFAKGTGVTGLIEKLDALCAKTVEAIAEGYKIIVLSDRSIGPERIPIPALIAVGAVHQHLVSRSVRTRIGLVIETGEAREVHHHCLLIGYGADAINPYLAFEALWQARLDNKFTDNAHLNTDSDLVSAYRKGTAKGLLKVMAKMGISTLQSYKGAQIFEAVGLAEDIIDRCFTGTISRVQGIDMAALVEEVERRHRRGYPDNGAVRISMLPNPGDVHWRKGGDQHMWNPEAIAKLQLAVGTEAGDDDWEAFSRQANEDATRRCTIRGLLKFKTGQTPVPLKEVEPESEIVKRFATGAMSFGSISREAHESLAIAMNRIGGKSNTGEGGEEDARFIPLANGDSKRSAIKQVASGRFGVTINYLSNADELQIKIVQGAKPGEGGELPGHKVDDIIAKVRHSTPGVGLISPPPHHDIYSIEDIAQLIHDLKNANPEARISVKLGSEIGVGAVAAGVTKAKSDHLVIAGHDGGTGASPLTSIKHAGMPWELGVAETHHTLVMNNLRSRVILQTDGQLKTGRDVAVACLLGAEEFGFATAPLVALGCIMMRKCHLNTCPVGIATQDPDLRKKFRGQPEQVVNYFFMVARELRSIMAQLGFRTVNEMIGRADLLDAEATPEHWKASGLDLRSLLRRSPEPTDCLGVYAQHEQSHDLHLALDNKLIELARPALTEGKPVEIDLPIVNTNRVVGGILSNRIIREVGPQMLPDNTIHVKLRGSAGQSLGAWLAQGVTLEVIGDANDYVGKGLSGGRVIIHPPPESPFKAEENVILGNVALYGATAGEAFFAGIAAERFCVRNSGASAVVEGVGDHACEYMTGGRVVVLGKTGRNFAAGMSGGIAYVFDPEKQFADYCNTSTVQLQAMENMAEIRAVKKLIEKHQSYTHSVPAKHILENWDEQRHHFIRVMPIDYQRALEAKAQKVQPESLSTA